MNGSRAEVDRIYWEASQRTSSDDRRAYLDSACRDDLELRLRVEQLLNAQPKAERFLERPFNAELAATFDGPPTSQLTDAQIGRYELIEEIGEGGMGVVYMAEQREPVRRNVALKIIKPGMDSREVIARFEAERQALALMNHPNIATVLDAGATEAGRPYFVMELVRGTPITSFCDDHKLDTRERLQLFITVVQAVQHAHQKGVIHRDIKPSNLLVEMQDVAPVPKIIDFGVAKAMGQQLTDKTLHTGFRQMVGTPLYMSPEQADRSNVDVDTRSDVYSLGVVLYELLTGTTPFARETLRRLGHDEIRRMICEVDPPRPSARVSTLRADTLSTVAERHQIEPRKLSRQLRGELDWIVMKAMEKDRARRYESASAMAADLERYLNDEPVHACPPSAWYRLRKQAGRHRVALVTSGLVALALVAGVVASTWQAVRATHAEQRTAAALVTSKERLQFARRAVDEMYTEVAEKWLAQEPEMTPLQKRFLERALAFYQRLAAEQGADPGVRFEAAKSQQRVGEIDQKLGHHAEAEAAFRRAITLFEQLVRESYDHAKCGQGLAGARDSLGRLLLFTGQPNNAAREIQLALTLRKALVDQFPGELRYQTDLAESHCALGNVQVAAGQLTEAETAYRASIAIYESLLKRSPTDRDLRFRLAESQSRVCNTMNWRTRSKEVEAVSRSAVAAATALVAEDPKDPESRRFLASSLESQGTAQFRLKRWTESEAALRKSLPIREGLAREFPQVATYHDDLARSLNSLGITLSRTGKLEEKEQLQRRSLEVRERLVTEHPEVPKYRNGLAGTLNNVAQSLMSRGEWQQARTLLDQAVMHQKVALHVQPEDKEYRRFLGIQLFNLAVVQRALGDEAAATRTAEGYAANAMPDHGPENQISAAVECCETLVEKSNELSTPGGTYAQTRDHAVAVCVLVSRVLIRKAIELALNEPTQFQIADFLSAAPEPLRDPELALKLAQKATTLQPDNASCAQSLGWALYRTGDWKGCIESLKRKAGGGTNDFVMAMANWQLGEKAKAKTTFDAASQWLKDYEQQCEESRKQRLLLHPQPSLLKRFQAEAAVLLQVGPATADEKPVPQKKPASEDKAKSG